MDLAVVLFSFFIVKWASLGRVTSGADSLEGYWYGKRDATPSIGHIDENQIDLIWNDNLYVEEGGGGGAQEEATIKPSEFFLPIFIPISETVISTPWPETT